MLQCHNTSIVVGHGFPGIITLFLRSSTIHSLFKFNLTLVYLEFLLKGVMVACPFPTISDQQRNNYYLFGMECNMATRKDECIINLALGVGSLIQRYHDNKLYAF